MHFTEAEERKSEDEEPVGHGSHLVGVDIFTHLGNSYFIISLLTAMNQNAHISEN